MTDTLRTNNTEILTGAATVTNESHIYFGYSDSLLAATNYNVKEAESGTRSGLIMQQSPTYYPHHDNASNYLIVVAMAFLILSMALRRNNN